MINRITFAPLFLVFATTLAAVQASAPLPNIGGWYRYAFSPKWHLSARLDWLSASVDVEKQYWRGAVDLTYQGPFISLTGNW